MATNDLRAKAELFAKLHLGPDILMLPNAWDVGSAVIMAQAGFPAIATTSAGVAVACGYADGENIGRDQMLEAVARIADKVSVPVTADLETGYGPHPADVNDTIRQAISIGLVGANIEDSGLDASTPLQEIEGAADRIRAARAAADAADIPFVINARADCYLKRPKLDPSDNFAETVRRAEAYLEAGAGCIFVPGVADAETIAGLVREIDAPINLLGAFSGTAALPLPELQRLGVRRVSLGGSLSLAVLAMVRRVCEEILTEGTFSYAPSALTNAEMNRMMR